MPNEFYTPPEISSHVVWHRWSPEILLTMKDGMQRFNQMLAGIQSISDRVLTERLRELEDWRLIDRTVYGGPPIKVMYGLTVAGRRYLEPIEQLAALRHEPGLQEAAVG